MDEVRGIPRSYLFGSIEIGPLSWRRDGNKLLSVGHSIYRDEFGRVTKEETYDIGTALILPAERWARNDSLCDVLSVSPELSEFIEPETWRDRWARRLSYFF